MQYTHWCGAQLLLWITLGGQAPDVNWRDNTARARALKYASVKIVPGSRRRLTRAGLSEELKNLIISS